MNRSENLKWRLKRGQGEVRWRDRLLQVNVQQPEQGISLMLPGIESTQLLFATPQVVVTTGEKLDPYSQGENLIVAYPCTEQRIFGGELSWRARLFPDADSNDSLSVLDNDTPGSTADVNNSDPDSYKQLLTMELVYSTQTNLLDTNPQNQLISKLTGQSVQYFACETDNFVPCAASERFVACIVQHLSWLTLVMVMPSDLVSCWPQVQNAGGKLPSIELTWNLSAGFLEKGVIRRFRAFSASSTNANALLSAATAFLHSEVPLTA